MLTKEKYVLNRVKGVLKNHVEKQRQYDIPLIISLIEQWEFDYDIEKAHRPETLKEL